MALAPITLRATNLPVATAGNDQIQGVGRSPVAGRVTRVAYFPNATMTGSATARTLSLFEGGAVGTGVVNMATLALTAGVNIPANTEGVIVLSATAANLVVAQGDVLQFQSLHVGAGIVDPGGLIEVDIQPFLT